MEAQVVDGKSLSILRALASEPTPATEGWIAFAAWKRKSHLEEKRKLVRRLLKVLAQDKLVEKAHLLYKAYEKGRGKIVKRDEGFGWQITSAGREVLEK